MKVLVHCHGREVRAATGRVFDGQGNVHLRYRKFEPIGKSNIGKAYMTPEEAQFLVESDENNAHVEHGQEKPFFYPMGYPVPVPDDKDGPLHPPLTDKSFHVSDARQVQKADKLIAERDAAIAAAKAAEEQGQSPEDPTKTLVDSAKKSANDANRAPRGRSPQPKQPDAPTENAGDQGDSEGHPGDGEPGASE